MTRSQARFTKIGLGLFFGILLTISVALLLSGLYLLVLGGIGFFVLANIVLTLQIFISLLGRNLRWIMAGLSLISLLFIIGSYRYFNQLSSYGFLVAMILIPFTVTSLQTTNHVSQRIKSIGLAILLIVTLLGLMTMQLQAIQQLKTHYQSTTPEAESWQQYGAL